MDEQLPQTRTELHTHLMGMLSTQAFLELLDFFDCRIFILGNEIVPSNIGAPGYSIKDIFDDKNLYNIVFNSISVPSGSKVKYSYLGMMYDARNLLLKECYQQLAVKHPYDDADRLKKKVFNAYYNLALQELIEQGVKYTEISYSNASVISSLSIDPAFAKKIDVRFLLSSQRTNSMKSFRSTKNNLNRQLAKTFTPQKTSIDEEVCIPNQAVIGFDLMGEEHPISTSNNNIDELYTILEMMVDTLHCYMGSVLRIHSGESPSCSKNTKILLQILHQIKHNKDITIPPPFVRIGHGIHIEKDPVYLQLLKEFDCDIEINASSNFALSNITDYKEIDYDFYIRNGVPVYISTDGHGMYNTFIEHEDEIAQSRISSKQYLTQILAAEKKYIGK